MHCLDAVCYHAGGPLTEGDIEDFGGVRCVTCPWHKYKVDLVTGQGLYLDLDRKVKSKGIRQRAHEVEVRPGEGVFVRLSLESPPKVASDAYCL